MECNFKGGTCSLLLLNNFSYFADYMLQEPKWHILKQIVFTQFKQTFMLMCVYFTFIDSLVHLISDTFQL